MFPLNVSDLIGGLGIAPQPVKPYRKGTPQKRTRRRAPGGWHPTKGPRTPLRHCNRREYKRRKKARRMQRRRNR